MGPTDIGATALNEFFFETHAKCNKYCCKEWLRPEKRYEADVKVGQQGSSTKSMPSKTTDLANAMNLLYDSHQTKLIMKNLIDMTWHSLKSLVVSAA